MRTDPTKSANRPGDGSRSERAEPRAGGPTKSANRPGDLSNRSLAEPRAAGRTGSAEPTNRPGEGSQSERAKAGDASLVQAARLDHVHLCVADRAASAAWYRRVLGLRVIGEPPGRTADGHPVFLGLPGAHTPSLSLFIGPAATGADRNVAFGVGADAFLAFAGALPDEAIRSQKGGLLERSDVHDYGLAFTFDFLDPDGNELELVTYEVAPVRTALAL